MRIAITGSSGLIGRAVTRALQHRGDEVIRVTRPTSLAHGVYWDPTTGQIERDKLEALDAVVHLAGETIEPLWTAARKRRIRQSRIKGTGLLARTLAELKYPPKVLVSASAIGHYGNRPGSEVVDEATAKGKGFLADVTEVWEGAAEPARAAGIRVVHPRFGLVLARGGGTLKYALPVFYLGLGGRLGSGEQVWSWVSLDDVAGSVIHLIDHPELSGPVNVTAPNPVTNAEFTRILAGVVHRPAFLVVPEFVLRLGGDAAQELLLSGARVMPRKLQASGYEFRHPELRQALQSILAREVGT